MSNEHIIALHATQQWSGRHDAWTGFILLSEEEAEKLENALRLARTGKIGVERTVIVKKHVASRDYEHYIVKTRIVVKEYHQEEMDA